MQGLPYLVALVQTNIKHRLLASSMSIVAKLYSPDTNVHPRACMHAQPVVPATHHNSGSDLLVRSITGLPSLTWLWRWQYLAQHCYKWPSSDREPFRHGNAMNAQQIKRERMLQYSAISSQ